MTITLILGDPGSGKSTLAAYVARKEEKDVMANFLLRIPNFVPLTASNALKIERPTHIIIDEAYSLVESRTSSKAENRFWSYVLMQSRKRSIDLTLIAQLASMVDVRFRELTQIVIVAQRVEGGFHYRAQRRSVTAGAGVVEFDISLEKAAEEIFPYYDTDEIIGFDDDDMLSLVDRAELLPDVDRLARELLASHDSKYYSKAVLKDIGAERGWGETRVDMVYNRIKRLA